MPYRPSVSSGTALDLERRMRYKQEKAVFIKVYCCIDIIWCTIFWFWALYHLIFEKLMDLGVITFPLVIVSAVFGILAVYFYEQKNDSRARYLGKVHCTMIIFSHFFLSANYVIGAIVEPGFWIDSFFILMAMFFALTALLYGKWSYQWYSQFSPPTGYSALNDDNVEKL